MNEKKFQHVVTIKKNDLVPFSTEEPPWWMMLSDKWFVSQLIALGISILGLAALLVGLEVMAAPADITVLRADAVEQSLMGFLKTQVGAVEGVDVVSQRHSQIPLFDIPKERVSWNWRGPELFSNGPRSVYQLTLSDDAGWQMSIPVNVSVRLQATVFAAKHNITAKSEVKEDDFVVRKMEIVPTLYHDLVVQKFPERQRAKTFISAGVILSRSQIEAMPAVKLGGLIELIFRQGNLVIRLPARSKQEGRVGETIQVQVEGQQKILQAIVQNESAATVVALP